MLETGIDGWGLVGSNFSTFSFLFRIWIREGGKSFIRGMEIEFMRERFDDNISLKRSGENLEYKIHPLFRDVTILIHDEDQKSIHDWYNFYYIAMKRFWTNQQPLILANILAMNAVIVVVDPSAFII